MPEIMTHPNCPFTPEEVKAFCSRLVEQPSGCWVRSGCSIHNYGSIVVRGIHYTNHRAAFLMTHGSIPFNLVIRHKCDNPPCCRPDHLELGSKAQNRMDTIQRGRNHTPTILNREQASIIKQAINEGTATQMELARRFAVTRGTINAIRLGITWVSVEPPINDIIPQPHRKLSDTDHVDIRECWRKGMSLKAIAKEYDVRVDTIQKILRGARGTSSPIGERVFRQNKTKHTAEARQEMLRRYLAGETQRALAAEYGFSKNGICLALQVERRMQSSVNAQ